MHNAARSFDILVINLNVLHIYNIWMVQQNYFQSAFNSIFKYFSKIVFSIYQYYVQDYNILHELQKIN